MWMPGKRNRFRDVVERQLALFSDDHDRLITRARARLAAYHEESDPDLAQLHYGEHEDYAEDVELELLAMRDRMASTMEERHRKRYLREFSRQAMRMYGDLLPHLKFGRDQD
jgi:hypothetical protein